MMRIIQTAAPFAFAIFLALPGCADTQVCGPGTHADGDIGILSAEEFVSSVSEPRNGFSAAVR